MNRLPALISIPHGGTAVPEELAGRVAMSKRDILHDADSFAVPLYDVGDAARLVVRAEIARAFVDLNRSLRDVPPANPDGVTKTSTFRGRPVYLEGMEPDGDLRAKLVRLHYMPYHRAIQRAIRDLDLQLCLDCHTMVPFAPEISPDPTHRERPAFCLSNRDGRTSSREMVDLLASCIAESYGVDRKLVSINDPFHGGHITATYGNNPVPWIQVEMNRGLYLADPWFDGEALSMDAARLRDLNARFADSLGAFFSRL